MKVAVAIITNDDRQFLITQRPDHTTHSGFWEFPGGKLEVGETPQEALSREIREEIGLEIISFNLLGEITHVYNEKQITLLLFHVDQFSGNAECREQQPDMRWVTFKELAQYKFPEANQKIIEIIETTLIS